MTDEQKIPDLLPPSLRAGTWIRGLHGPMVTFEETRLEPDGKHYSGGEGSAYLRFKVESVHWAARNSPAEQVRLLRVYKEFEMLGERGLHEAPRAEAPQPKRETKLRPVVAWFAELMELKLRKNDDRGGWKNCDISYLARRLNQERLELEVALESGGHEIPGEAVDVANFAMMIADRATPGYRDQAPAEPDDTTLQLRNLLARLHGDGGHRQAREGVQDADLFAACDAAAVEALAKLDQLRSLEKLPELYIDSNTPSPFMIPYRCRLPQFGDVVAEAGDRLTVAELEPWHIAPTFSLNGSPLEHSVADSKPDDDIERKLKSMEDDLSRGFTHNVALQAVDVLRALVPLIRKAAAR